MNIETLPTFRHSCCRNPEYKCIVGCMGGKDCEPEIIDTNGFSDYDIAGDDRLRIVVSRCNTSLDTTICNHIPGSVSIFTECNSIDFETTKELTAKYGEDGYSFSQPRCHYDPHCTTLVIFKGVMKDIMNVTVYSPGKDMTGIVHFTDINDTRSGMRSPVRLRIVVVPPIPSDIVGVHPALTIAHFTVFNKDNGNEQKKELEKKIVNETIDIIDDSIKGGIPVIVFIGKKVMSIEDFERRGLICSSTVGYNLLFSPACFGWVDRVFSSDKSLCFDLCLSKVLGGHGIYCLFSVSGCPWFGAGRCEKYLRYGEVREHFMTADINELLSHGLNCTKSSESMDFLELPDDVNILVPDVCSMKDHERVFDILIKSDVDYIGIDTEWTGSNVLGVISFYVPDKNPYAILIRPSKCDEEISNFIRKKLRVLFTGEDHRCYHSKKLICFDFKGDILALTKSELWFGDHKMLIDTKCELAFALPELYNVVCRKGMHKGSYITMYGLADIVYVVLGKKLAKDLQTSDWQADVLTEKQQLYAVLDAYAVVAIWLFFKSAQ